MVDFAGWSMPIQYTSIVEEHSGHPLGRRLVRHLAHGPIWNSRATARSRCWIDCHPACDATRSQAHIRYALMTNQQGGILDDVLVYHLP